MFKRWALVLSLALALLGGAVAPVQAQWGASAASCDTPYDFGWSGFYGSNCRSTFGYVSGWGSSWGTADYAAGRGWWRPVASDTSYMYGPAAVGYYRCIYFRDC